MYTTFTLIIEVLRNTAAFNDCYRELMPYTALVNSYWVTVYHAYLCQGTHINDKDYSWHITDIELI